MFLRNAAAAILVAASFTSSTSHVLAADTPAIGGSGGEAFRAECPANQFLTGLEVKAGKVIDAITPLCAPAGGNARLGPATAQQTFGGASNAKARKAVCAPTTYLSGLKAARTGAMIVSSIQVTCHSIENATVAESTCINAPGGCRGAPAECVQGEAAIGIHGRAGKTLNAIGLICGPRPGAEPAAAQAEPPASGGEQLDKAAEEPPAAAESPPPPETESAKAEPAPATRGLKLPSPPPPAPIAAAKAPPKTMTAPAPPPVPVKAPPQPDSADGKWSLVPVFFGTDRKAVEGAKHLSYGYDRARKLQIGRALVSVPTEHQVPNVERPWALTIPGTNITVYEEEEDPAKHFTMREIKTMTSDDFLKVVKERLKGSKTYKDQALIFIHGYNCSFDNAIYRLAQITHDLKFDGAPFLYSWPSRGELSGYTYDRTSNEQAEPFMREFVELVAKKSGAKQVSVIAHSMGNQLTLRVLHELKSAKIAINQIILAAPDVDRDSFENIAREMQGLSKGITLYAAANDMALLAARKFHGGVPRAGDVPETGPVVVPGVDTIDVTALSTDSLGLNHSTYAERTVLIDDIGRLLMTGTRPPMKRTPALIRVPAGAAEYWRFPKQ